MAHHRPLDLGRPGPGSDPALHPAPGEPVDAGRLAAALQRWLVDAVELALGPLAALRRHLLAPREEERQIARGRAAAALSQASSTLEEKLIGALAEKAGAADGWLERARHEAGEAAWDAWIRRIVQLAFERLLGDPVAPELHVQLVPLEPGEIERALPGRFTQAVVCGELVGFTGELFPLVLDARDHELACGGGGINVLGVHERWLTQAGAAARAIYFDVDRDALVEASFTTPVPVHGVHFLYLGAAHEQERHRELSSRLGGRVQANPYAAAARADSKWQTTLLLRAAGVPTPAAVRIPADAPPNAVTFALEALAPEALAAGMVVQPDRGTEGQGVACFPAPHQGRAHPAALEHIRRLQRGGEVLVRGCIAGRRWPEGEHGHSADLRVNVAWDGERYRAESGYLQVSGDPAAFPSSVGQGGRIVKLSEGALEGLRLTDGDREGVLATACAAASALAAGAAPGARLALVGLDLKLEGEPGQVRAWVLDANPRPAGLSYSERFDTREPGVATSLWSGLLSSAVTDPGGGPHDGDRTHQQ